MRDDWQYLRIKSLTFRVLSDCPLNEATISIGYSWDRDFKKAMRIEINCQTEGRTWSIWPASQYSPVGSSAGYRWDGDYSRKLWKLKSNDKLNAVQGKIRQLANTVW